MSAREKTPDQLPVGTPATRSPAAEHDSMVLTAKFLPIVAPFIAKSDTRYYLTGINVRPLAAGGVTIAGCNGHVLGVFHDPDGVCATEVTLAISNEMLTACAACTVERFLCDVAKHEMTVIRDDGVHRHIRFAEPGTGEMHFDLITWPGVLCYTGDMGTYVFQRTNDMFEFFRQDRAYNQSRGRPLSINLGYWTEKLIAIDGSRHGGKVKEFDGEKFKRVINEYRVGWMRGAKGRGTLDKNGRRELWQAVENEVIGALEDGGDRAQHAAYNFNFYRKADSRRPYGWSFTDLFEHDFTEYTHSIIWCCYALAWGIEQYDASKLQPAHEGVIA